MHILYSTVFRRMHIVKRFPFWVKIMKKQRLQISCQCPLFPCILHCRVIFKHNRYLRFLELFFLIKKIIVIYYHYYFYYSIYLPLPLFCLVLFSRTISALLFRGSKVLYCRIAQISSVTFKLTTADSKWHLLHICRRIVLSVLLSKIRKVCTKCATGRKNYFHAKLWTKMRLNRL